MAQTQTPNNTAPDKQKYLEITGSRSKVDQGFLIFDQITRTNYALSHGNANFFYCLEGLESMIPDLQNDEDYQEKVKQIYEEKEAEINKLPKGKDGKVDEQKSVMITFKYDIKRYRLLMLKAQKYFPEEEAVVDI